MPRPRGTLGGGHSSTKAQRHSQAEVTAHAKAQRHAQAEVTARAKARLRGDRAAGLERGQGAQRARRAFRPELSNHKRAFFPEMVGDA